MSLSFFFLFFFLSPAFPPPAVTFQAISAQEDLEKTREELKTAITSPPAPEHDDEHDELNSEAEAELVSDGVSSQRSEEERVTEAEKNDRVKKQLQVRTRILLQEKKKKRKTL